MESGDRNSEIDTDTINIRPVSPVSCHWGCELSLTRFHNKKIFETPKYLNYKKYFNIYTSSTLSVICVVGQTKS